MLSYRKQSINEDGAIFIELVLALSLIIVMVLGLAQQFMKVLHELDHYALATEITLGPQDPTLGYMASTPDGFVENGQPGSSIDITHYIEHINEFIKTQAVNSSYVFVTTLRYININKTTGLIKTLSADDEQFQIKDMSSSDTSACTQYATSLTMQADLENYLNLKHELWGLYGTGHSPTNEDDDNGRFGVKLFDFKQGGTRYREYIPKLPMLFVAICSEVPTLLYPETVVTYHTIVPRRLLN